VLQGYSTQKSGLLDEEPGGKRASGLPEVKVYGGFSSDHLPNGFLQDLSGSLTVA